MSDIYGRQGSTPYTQTDAAIDPGLRKFMLGVYNKMGLGLIVSAALAYAVGAYAPLTQLVFGTPFYYVVLWGPVAILLLSNFMMRNPSPTGSAVLYWAIVALMGMGLGVWVFLALSGTGVTTRGGAQLLVTFGTMAQAFLLTAASFGALSLWGYTTKKNLSGIHSMLVMATWGLAAVAVLGFFLHSSMLEMGIQFAGIAIFGLLMATQTNMLREFYFYNRDNVRSLAVMTNMGALNLYIAFVQVFQLLLSLMSRR